MPLHARTDTRTLLSEPSAPNKQGTCVLKCNHGKKKKISPSPVKPKGREQVFGDVKCLLWGLLALISFSSVSIRAIPQLLLLLVSSGEEVEWDENTVKHCFPWCEIELLQTRAPEETSREEYDWFHFLKGLLNYAIRCDGLYDMKKLGGCSESQIVKKKKQQKNN